MIDEMIFHGKKYVSEDRYAKLEQENQQFRKALERIATPTQQPLAMKRIAREALEDE